MYVRTYPRPVDQSTSDRQTAHWRTLANVVQVIIIIIIIIYIAHTNIGTDTERKKSKGKRANHMIQF